MIKSRPRTPTFLSFLFFLAISFVLITINLFSIFHDPHPPWFNYLIVVILTPIMIFIAWKIIFRYKIVRMGNAQIILHYPQFATRKAYPLKQIVWWKETVVKTSKTSTYKELEIKFSDNRMITMAFQEYTEYEKMIAYLQQKAGKLKQ